MTPIWITYKTSKLNIIYSSNLNWIHMNKGPLMNIIRIAVWYRIVDHERYETSLQNFVTRNVYFSNQLRI